MYGDGDVDFVEPLTLPIGPAPATRWLHLKVFGRSFVSSLPSLPHPLQPLHVLTQAVENIAIYVVERPNV